MSEEVSATQFYTVKATVTRNPNGTLHGTYSKASTEIMSVNAVISFQLDTTLDGVVFWGLDITPPTKDFGPPSINAGGLLLTIDDTDRDTRTTTYNATLRVFDPRTSTVVSIDPQIINRRT